jgi:hypothetical protein
MLASQMLTQWHTIKIEQHCLLGTPALSQFQPFDLRDWSDRWATRLAGIHRPTCLVHQAAAASTGTFPFEVLKHTWSQGFQLLVLDDEGMTTSLADLKPVLCELMSMDIRQEQVMLWSDAGYQGMAFGQSLSAFSNPDSNQAAVFTDEITHHYVMLARVPRRHRLLAACALIDRRLEDLGRISCGSGGYENYSYGPQEFMVVPERLRDRFPLYIDGPVAHDDPAIHIASVQHPAVTGAFAQLVCESNWDDPDPVISNRWKLMQLTEKSSKPLLLGQVFVLNSAPHTVAALRDLGFDCFDDLIDHSYDREPDPIKRVAMSVDRLAELCQQPLGHWQDWRERNRARLLYNRQHFLELSADINALHRSRFQAAVNNVDTARNLA